jgi:hypothetical protein
MIWRVRRVLTGHDAEGRSTIIADGVAPNIKEMPSFPGLALTDLWETASAPADNDGHGDAAARPIHLEPPKNGTPRTRPARKARTAGKASRRSAPPTRRTSTRPIR